MNKKRDMAELFSGIRHIAINILTQHQKFKSDLKRKIKNTAMDKEYFTSVLAGYGIS